MDLRKELKNWQARLINLNENVNGAWRLCNVEPSPILGHHIVRTINELGQPTINTPVIFRYQDPVQPIDVPKDALKWIIPGELCGFSQSTSFAGIAQFIYLQKVCDIFILDLQRPSDIVQRVHNADLAHQGHYSETGVQLTFQLNRPKKV